MAHIVVLGAGIGGLPCAYGLRERLAPEHRVTMINERDYFQFVPSNPWAAVGWRDRESITFDLRSRLEPKGIDFIAKRCDRIDAENSRLELDGGTVIEYDYLVIATGPRPAFEEVAGADLRTGHIHSICTIDHTLKAYDAYRDLLQDPGKVIIGAMPFANCFGPAYEFAFIMDADLRKRRMRDKVTISYVTSEPYIGHMGLGSVGDLKAFLESDLRARGIDWITNAKVTRVEAGRMYVDRYDDAGQLMEARELEFKYSVMLPAFKGVDVVARVSGLCDSQGFVLVDAHQRSSRYSNIYSVGVSVAMPAVEETPVPTGAPKTGYATESMVTAAINNIDAELCGRKISATSLTSAVCLADMGDTGAAFVASPQAPPRNLLWFKQGKWVHMAKIAFEKYFLRKLKRGSTESIYDKYLLKMLDIGKLE